MADTKLSELAAAKRLNKTDLTTDDRLYVAQKDGSVYASKYIDPHDLTRVLTYADATARDAAIPSPSDGQVVFNEDVVAVQTYSSTLGIWRTAGRSILRDVAWDLWVEADYGVNLDDGAAVASLTSRDSNAHEFLQATVGNQPAFDLHKSPYANRSTIVFDGDDALKKAAPILSGTQGMLIAVGTNDNSGGDGTIYAQSSESDGNHFFSIKASVDTGRIKLSTKNSSDGQINAFTDSADAADCFVWMVHSDGHAIRMYVNGVEKDLTINVENEGQWVDYAVPANHENAVIGAIIDNSGTPEIPLTGDIAVITGIDGEVSTSLGLAVVDELMRKYGVK